VVLVNCLILGQSNVSYATLLSIQHSNVPNYPPITCKIMLIWPLILHLWVLLLLGFLIQVLISMWHLILQVWRTQNLILVLINCMLEMVRALLSLILLILKSMHLNVHLPYPIFYTYRILQILCYQFKICI